MAVDQFDEEIFINRNSEKLYNAFKPAWWFLFLMGQMPFQNIVTGPTKQPLHNLRFNTFSIPTIIYGIVFLCFGGAYSLSTAGLVHFFVFGKNFTPLNTTDSIIRMDVTVPKEKHKMKEQLIPLLVTWAENTFVMVGFISTFLQARRHVQYYNYWNRVVTNIDIDPTMGIRKYLRIQNTIMFVLAAAIFGVFFSGFISYNRRDKYKEGLGFEFCALLSFIMVEMFGGVGGKSYFEPEDAVHGGQVRNQTAFLLYLVAWCTMAYGLIASRAQMMPFLFYCKMLTNASAIWNARLRNCLNGGSETFKIWVQLKNNKQSHRRVGYGNLLKDHLVLVQLFKMTEATFSTQILSFYLVNIFCFVLETYYLVSATLNPLSSPFPYRVIKYRPLDDPYNLAINKPFQLISPEGFYEDLDHVVPNEVTKTDEFRHNYFHVFMFCVTAVFILYRLYILYDVTSQAGQAYDHAMRGFLVVRKYGFMHCRNKAERNFIHSLVFSFARNNPLWITGGGYFPLNSSLLAGMVANIINLVVFMYQYKPDEWEDLEYHWES